MKWVIASILFVPVAAAAVPVFRHTVSLRTVYEFDTRLWFLQLKFRGEVPQVGWAEALRRVGPGWPQRARFDVAQVVGGGAAPCPVLWTTPLGHFWGDRAGWP